MNKADLTERQQEVLETVCGEPRSTLVLGGPGTGKTTAALWTAREFLDRSSDGFSRVLFLTFSRAAVSQIVARAGGVLHGFEDRIETSTFHSLALRVLRAFGRYAGRGIAEPSLQSPTRIKLLGSAEGQLSYDDLIPGAVKILTESADSDTGLNEVAFDHLR